MNEALFSSLLAMKHFIRHNNPSSTSIHFIPKLIFATFRRQAHLNDLDKRLKLLLCRLLFSIFSIAPFFGQGETCGTAVNVGSVPFNYGGSTCGSGSDYTIADNETDNPNLCDYPDPPFSGQDAFIEGEDKSTRK